MLINYLKIKKKVKSSGSSFFVNKKFTLLILTLVSFYFILISFPLLNIIRKKHRSDYFIIGHYHVPFKLGKIVILETFMFRNKVYKLGSFYLLTDVHLGLKEYNEKELKKLYNIIKKEKVIILGDLVEKLPIRDLNEVEKLILEEIDKGIKEKRVFWIKGNHDPNKKQPLLLKVKTNNITYLFGHGHFSFFPFHFSDLIKVLNQKNVDEVQDCKQ